VWIIISIGPVTLLDKRVLVSERVLDFLNIIIYAYRTTMPVDACCFFSCHIHIVSRKRDDKVEKEKMLHGDKEKTCNLSLGRLGKRDKKYKRHEGISKRLTGGFPGQSECGDE
jgi:hypothetical protein